MPTLMDISRKTGLSVATVSNALNGRAGYSQATRHLVRRTAQELGYTANPLARGLLGKGTKTVGLLWTLAGPHMSEGMARGIALRMQKRGYVTHLTDSLSDPEIVRRQLADYRQRGVEAVVMQDATGKLLTEDVCRQLKAFSAAVAVGSDPPELEMDWIRHDILAGYRRAADHLADTGRRRPAIFSSIVYSKAKIEAFLGRCQERGMTVSDRSAINLQHVGPPNQLVESAIGSLEGAFSGKFNFDSLICTADEIAAAAILWLRRRGMRVPEDVAVIGCNNAMFSICMAPPLASIERRDEEVAEAIEEMIFSRLAEPELAARRREIAMRFVWRESAGGTGAADEYRPGRGQGSLLEGVA
jgi:DNA-binding LacI/PurR family transcriptional regulator